MNRMTLKRHREEEEEEEEEVNVCKRTKQTGAEGEAHEAVSDRKLRKNWKGVKKKTQREVKRGSQMSLRIKKMNQPTQEGR